MNPKYTSIYFVSILLMHALLLFFSSFLHILGIHTTLKPSTLFKKKIHKQVFSFAKYKRTNFLTDHGGRFILVSLHTRDQDESALTPEQYYSTCGVSIFCFHLIRRQYYACFGRIINHQKYNLFVINR